MKLEQEARKLRAGFESAFSTWKRFLSTFLISFISFVLIALSGALGYSSQMLRSGMHNWIPAVEMMTYLIYAENGWTGIGLNIVYSLLIGVTLTNFYIQLRATGLQLKNLTGIAPGFLVAGCAGCGLGLLSLAGLTGTIAVLPFNGSLIKLTGLGLLIFFIARTGNPETCSIPGS